METGTLERLALWKAPGEVWNWILIYIFSALCWGWTSLPMFIAGPIYLWMACLYSLPILSTRLFVFFLLTWVKLFVKHSNPLIIIYVAKILFKLAFIFFMVYIFCHMEVWLLCPQTYQPFPVASGFYLLFWRAFPS